MKFYTKEWYELMQRQNYTSGMKKIPDKIYTDDEIKAFYDKDLKDEIAHDREIHNTPAQFSDSERNSKPLGRHSRPRNRRSKANRSQL